MKLTIHSAKEKNVAESRSFISLAIIWVMAGLMTCLVLFLHKSPRNLFSKGNIISQERPASRDEIVFVSLNKRFVITRYPNLEIMDESDQAANANDIASRSQKPVVRVHTMNKATRSEEEDFSIKPVPK